MTIVFDKGAGDCTPNPRLMKTVFDKMSAQGWQRPQPGVPSGGMGYLRTWMRTDVRRVAARRCRLLRYLVTVVAAVGMRRLQRIPMC